MNIPYPAVVSHHFTLYTHGRLQGVQNKPKLPAGLRSPDVLENYEVVD